MSFFDFFNPNPKPPKREKKPRKPIPKRGKKWKAATPAEQEWMKLMKQLPCCACGDTFCVEVHHITDGGRRLGHLYTIPLCFCCHEGNYCSIGNTKKKFIAKYGTELELLKKVRDLVKLAEDIHDKTI